MKRATVIEAMPVSRWSIWTSVFWTARPSTRLAPAFNQRGDGREHAALAGARYALDSKDTVGGRQQHDPGTQLPGVELEAGTILSSCLKEIDDLRALDIG